MDWQAEYDQLRSEIEAPGAFGKYSISAPGRMGLDELKAAWWSKLLELKKAGG